MIRELYDSNGNLAGVIAPCDACGFVSTAKTHRELLCCQLKAAPAGARDWNPGYATLCNACTDKLPVGVVRALAATPLDIAGGA